MMSMFMNQKSLNSNMIESILLQITSGLTEEQFGKIAVHLVENATPEQLAKAPGIG